MRLMEDAIDSRLETLLLRAIDSYESRHRTDPTVVELAAYLGIPPTSDTAISWGVCGTRSQPASSPTTGAGSV